MFDPSPPQGFSNEQQQSIVLRRPIPLFEPPQRRRGRGPVGSLLLDLFPGSIASFSLRLLRTEYIGSAIRVIRTSDDTEQDIGFLPDGTLDIPTLQAFVGVSDGLVKILYDQSNGFDADAQTDPDDMPRIIVAGILQTVNSLPALFFDGINDFLLTTSSIPSLADHLFTFSVWQKKDLDETGGIFNLNSPSVAITNRCFALILTSTGQVFWDAGGTTDRLLVSTTNDLLQHQWTLTKTDGLNNQTIRRDGSVLAARTPVQLQTIVNNIIIGRDSPTGTRISLSNFQEFVFYDTDELSNIVGIENNQINFWQAVFLRVTANGDQRITPEGDTRILA